MAEPPWQEMVIGPGGKTIGVCGKGLTVTVVGAETAEHPLIAVTLTV